ncbi:caspase-3 [Nephila pilipes]|uniref:Caspase-3 n=1 Tax=Nephila pilipes TaxID=299642 RepID=A0A8X6QYZ5_NEPPI|nr:caspase-3 [Nephila pilipes]
MSIKTDIVDAGGLEQLEKVITEEPSLKDASVKKQLEVEDKKTEVKVGDCHIFDYQKFSIPRLGSEKDAIRLEHDFDRLDFDVHRYLDLSVSKTKDVLLEASKKNHSQSKYFVCCFLTHGDSGKLYMPDGDIDIDAILSYFSRTSCPSLSGKPKIFIIQACRGNCCEEGITEITGDGIDESTDPGSIGDNPDYLDFLIANSTYEGTYSFKTLNLREKTKNHGSYYIDELCRSLEHFSSEKDLLQILTIVNYRIAIFFKSRTDDSETNMKKQMPCVTSRLRTKINFNKKIDIFESVDTQHFDQKRKMHDLGLQSMQNPSLDHQLYHIPCSENIKFLSILNTAGNSELKLNFLAAELWSCVAEKKYQRAEKENLNKRDLKNYLKKYAYQLKSTVKKLLSILKNNEGCEDLLNSLTKMNYELVKDFEFYSLSDKNRASFSLHSTLTKMVKLP